MTTPDLAQASWWSSCQWYWKVCPRFISNRSRSMEVSCAMSGVLSPVAVVRHLLAYCCVYDKSKVTLT